MTTADALDQGRVAIDRHRWGDAYAHLSEADRETALEPADLERLAVAAHLVGKDDECVDLLERAHHGLVSLGDEERAARCAFWLGFNLMNRGEFARGGGWLARARRLLDDGERECVELGYLLSAGAFQATMAGDFEAGNATFTRAATIGDRFGDRDLINFARHGQGRTLLRMGKIAEGLALLDEVMVAVTSGEVSPVVAGTVYCSVIEACQEISDLRRAQEWTAALTHWCESQQGLVPYSGQCLVHRTQIMVLHGEWPDAIDEARRACERFLMSPGHPAVGAAYYEQAELHRLRGEFAAAEEPYRLASRYGRQPQPGLAQLRLAQGQLDAAAAMIRRAVDEAPDPMSRSKLLGAHVDILLATGNTQTARSASGELSEIAADFDSPPLRAAAARAEGAVLLAEGEPRAALGVLRRAWTAWHDLEAPYEAARTRVHIALACRELGDEDTALMELDAARWAFQQLGAEPEIARLEELSRKAVASATGGLTAREVQVLRLVAAGKTNRAIAGDLFLSEKTVARHLSNIFTKLGLSSRSAATAYAYQHDLV
ncbi:MAG TPA: LuxR C-terminal-related transcriptional regulator [Jiangellaceae bacterium]|nr:LuxR C-terminal-related transcriptional regulator [Jiangellaceae bacterium]